MPEITGLADSDKPIDKATFIEWFRELPTEASDFVQEWILSHFHIITTETQLYEAVIDTDYYDIFGEGDFIESIENEVIGYSCELCSEDFRSEESIICHIIAEHWDEILSLVG